MLSAVFYVPFKNKHVARLNNLYLYVWFKKQYRDGVVLIINYELIFYYIKKVL